jgi:hypothetical protein
VTIGTERYSQFVDDKGSDMAVWALILLVGGLVGMLGAALIVAFIWESINKPFRRWETLP